MKAYPHLHQHLYSDTRRAWDGGGEDFGGAAVGGAEEVGVDAEGGGAAVAVAEAAGGGAQVDAAGEHLGGGVVAQGAEGDVRAGRRLMRWVTESG